MGAPPSQEAVCYETQARFGRVEQLRFDEKRARFDNFLRHDFPQEVVRYIDQYMDQTVHKLTKQLDLQNKQVRHEVNQLKGLNTCLKKEKNKLERHFEELDQEWRRLKDAHVEHQLKLFDALGSTEQQPTKPGQGEPAHTAGLAGVRKNLIHEFEVLDRVRGERAVDILDQLDNLWK